MKHIRIPKTFNLDHVSESLKSVILSATTTMTSNLSNGDDRFLRIYSGKSTKKLLLSDVATHIKHN